MNDDQVEDLYRRGLRDIERFLGQVARLLRVAAGLKNGTIKPPAGGSWAEREAEFTQPDPPDTEPTP